MNFYYLLVQKSLNRLAFVQKFETNLPLVGFTNLRMVGMFLPYKTRFNIEQYILGAVSGSLRSLVFLSI